MQSKITMESWSLASQPGRPLWVICHSESTADGLLPTRTASGSGMFCSEPPCRDPEMCTTTCLTHREGHQGPSYRHRMRLYAKYRDSYHLSACFTASRSIRPACELAPRLRTASFHQSLPSREAMGISRQLPRRCLPQALDMQQHMTRLASSVGGGGGR